MAKPIPVRWTAQKRAAGPEPGDWELLLDCEDAREVFERAGEHLGLGVDTRVLMNGEQFVVYRVEAHPVYGLSGEEPDFPVDKP